ncbi:MAG: sulfite exporter TauE/SafE family protein [Kangiellaceae bacterium]|nr:sulfite exporter TauE/SafE family protein [Kangiellaceae bacterium]
METVTLSGAVLLGLLGAGHCLAMCGGIITSLSITSSAAKYRSNWSLVLLYQVGRITSYTFFGAVVGWIGLEFNQLSALPILKTLSGLLLIAMALYINQWWYGLSYLEKAGKLIWKRISPLSKNLLPVKNHKQALLLGGLWGWLPCGLVYTSLGFALSLGNSLSSAAFMFCFGIGTLPATLFAGSASLSIKKLLNKPGIRLVSSLFFLVMGIYTLYVIYIGGEAAHHH